MDTTFCVKNDQIDDRNMYQMVVHVNLSGLDREILWRIACGDTMDMAAENCKLTRSTINNRLRALKQDYKAYTTNQVIHIATKLGHI
jgi:DNA-binding NarL/FixJ family response regulator